MSKELGYVLITPYTLRKSRTGGVLGRLLSRTGLDLVAARMFGPSPELVTRYAELIRNSQDVWPEIREILPEYIEREFAPTEDGQPQLDMRGLVLTIGYFGEHSLSRIGVMYSWGEGHDTIPTSDVGRLLSSQQTFQRVDYFQSFFYVFLSSTFRY